MTDKFKQYRLENGEIYGWICLDKEELAKPVPANFPKSENRTWQDYSTVINLPNGLSFLLIGEHDSQGNRKECITDEELMLWQEHFTGRNIWNYADAQEYMKQFNVEE